MKYCSRCNREFPDTSRFCPECGADLATEAAAYDVTTDNNVKTDNVRTEEVKPNGAASINRHIESHLIKSIVAAVCCCLPFGIAGIVYAARVKPLLDAGNINAALETSKKASLWSNVAIGLGLLQYLLWTLLYGTIIASMASMLPDFNSLSY